MEEKVQSVPSPLLLRVYNNGHKGATAFFRNRPLLNTFFSALRSRCGQHIKILVHASSLGAEPYSLALWWLNRVLPQVPLGMTIEIAATDIDSSFLAVAKEATYPEEVFAGMTGEEQSWFHKTNRQIVVPDAARKLVRFLKPMSFVDGDPGELFDAVLILNALTYVTPAEQSKALERCGAYTRHVLAVTAFHPDSIVADLINSGFEPCMDNHRQIHEAWGNRLRPGPIDLNSPEYSWRLPLYQDLDLNYAYRYGSVFLRES